MKICLLNVLHDALDKRMYHKIARSLIDAGHEVVSIAPGAEEATKTLDKTGGVRFIPIPAAHSFAGRLVSVAPGPARPKTARGGVHCAGTGILRGCPAHQTDGGRQVVLDMHDTSRVNSPSSSRVFSVPVCLGRPSGSCASSHVSPI